jgi:hypothetical protein
MKFTVLFVVIQIFRTTAVLSFSFTYNRTKLEDTTISGVSVLTSQFRVAVMLVS